VTLAWAYAACVPALGDPRPRSTQYFADTIVLTHTQAVPAALVDAAISLWANCPGYGRDFPGFVRGNRGGTYGSSRVVEIVLGGSNEDGEACAAFQGSRVALYSEARAETGTPMACGDRVGNLAHELGHVLGLGHSPRGLRDPIMGSVPRPGRIARSVSTHDCSAVGSRWLTTAELD
jgi:hypothetical protein